MANPLQQIRNVGLLAHVDAGKTTTTEQMLYLTGRIRTVGSVDAGTAQTDFLDVEQERGISVRMATTVLPWQGFAINLVDTPGHVDFAAEVERSLRVMDGAVLIVSAAEGVQAHTETLWHALRSLGIPTLIYVNKVDRLGVDIAGVLEAIRSALTDRAVPIQVPNGTEDGFTALHPAPDDDLAQALADVDTAVMERYINDGAVARAFLEERLASLTRSGDAFPVLFGASNKGLGVRELLEAVVRYLPPPAADPGAPLAGVVFKVERDNAMGRMAYVRLYGGQVRNRDGVAIPTRGADGKVTQIRKMYARHHEDVGALQAGEIGVLCGLGAVRVGDVLGDPAGVPAVHEWVHPVLSVRVHPMREADLPKLVEALQELTDEDPHLDFRWLQEVRELHVKVMGAIQIEILTSLLQSRFGLAVRFEAPSVIYCETPTHVGEGYEAYTMPKPCWAVLRFHMEPGARGSGLVYSSVVGADQLLPAYQREVEKRVPQALEQGLRGWQVTDLRVTLVYGQHHIYHTHPLDWAVATPMAIMNGLTNTGTTLLEPLYSFRATVPDEAGGRLLSELVQMRGQFEPPVVTGGRFIVDGVLPVATSLDFGPRLASLTGGRGVIATRFAGYQAAPAGVSVARPRMGVNPLDRAKYILSVRGAL